MASSLNCSSVRSKTALCPSQYPLLCSARRSSSKVHAAAITKDTKVEDIQTPDDVAPLFYGVKVGDYTLDTRVVYAPLTRMRSIGQVPPEISVPYYKNRAHKGQLVITEATAIDATAHGYPNTPGIYTPDQKEAWKIIVQNVHDKGATFFCQIWHVGRISLPVYQPGGIQPVGPSAVAPVDTFTFDPATGEPTSISAPRPLQVDEIPQIINSFRAAARSAVKEVGFDGVEIHGGNGYIIDQFLKTSSNKRTDEYGGSIENRCRLCLEILDAVIEEVGVGKVGLRLVPYGAFNDAYDEDPKALFDYLAAQVSKRKIAYLHMVESRVKGDQDNAKEGKKEILDSFKAAAKPVPFIAAGGYERDSAAEAIAIGHADMVAVGRYALANPDLLKRWKLNAPLNKYNRPTFYTPGPEGLIDYPLLEDTEHGSEYFL